MTDAGKEGATVRVRRGGEEVVRLMRASRGDALRRVGGGRASRGSGVEIVRWGVSMIGLREEVDGERWEERDGLRGSSESSWASAGAVDVEAERADEQPARAGDRVIECAG